jgi:glycogen debranching enzyme
MSSVLDRTVLKEGQLYLVADRAGDITSLSGDGHGLYYRDTRHLSLFEMELNGTRLALLSSAGELNFMSNLQLANETLIDEEGTVVAPARSISVRRNRFLLDGLHERLGFLNYNPEPVSVVVRLTVGSDFRDMFDVRGYHRPNIDQRGELLPVGIVDDGLHLAYRGRDGSQRRTLVRFEPSPTRIDVISSRAEPLDGADEDDARADGQLVPPTAAAIFELTLPPTEARSVTVTILPQIDEADPRPHGQTLDSAFIGIRDSYHAWDAAATQIETDHDGLDALLRRARHDLRLLTDDVAGEMVPTAGIPWFAVPFGRDSLITGMQTLLLRPELLAGTLRFLARHQGHTVTDYRDEEPGKILHEVRLGELARLGAVPHAPYYGSVDSTPLFLVALAEYTRWTGDLDLVHVLMPNAERALEWMDRHGDGDGTRFLEYRSRSEHGIRNQGWKDSADSVAHRDGTLAELPIALAEVQAYAYAAHTGMAELYACVGESAGEREQLARAERLREHFLRAFAMEDEHGPYWAMALDGGQRRVESVTSNPGHALWAGMLSGPDAALTIRRLTAEEMLCGWGVRTLSGRARTFNPMSYHNGSVWPHDNALIALGMKRVGADDAAREVATQVLEAGLRFPNQRLPELFCGFARDRHYHAVPAQYPVSCSPQAWAAGSAFMLLQALLGLEVDASAGIVRFRPLLPFWLGRLSLRRLRVAGRAIDVDVFREGQRTLVDVPDDAGLQIEVGEPLEA